MSEQNPVNRWLSQITKALPVLSSVMLDDLAQPRHEIHFSTDCYALYVLHAVLTPTAQQRLASKPRRSDLMHFTAVGATALAAAQAVRRLRSRLSPPRASRLSDAGSGVITKARSTFCP